MVPDLGDGYVHELDCVDHFTVYTYTNTSSCMPWMRVIPSGQLYLNKAENLQKKFLYLYQDWQVVIFFPGFDNLKYISPSLIKGSANCIESSRMRFIFSQHFGDIVLCFFGFCFCTQGVILCIVSLGDPSILSYFQVPRRLYYRGEGAQCFLVAAFLMASSLFLLAWICVPTIFLILEGTFVFRHLEQLRGMLIRGLIFDVIF